MLGKYQDPGLTGLICARVDFDKSHCVHQPHCACNYRSNMISVLLFGRMRGGYLQETQRKYP